MGFSYEGKEEERDYYGHIKDYGLGRTVFTHRMLFPLLDSLVG